LPNRFGIQPWDRTYFAQFERDCPFQIRYNEKMSEALDDDAPGPRTR
jgi:hypothetical protein